MIRCPVCNHSFNQRDALCEDWNDPAKKLGCPSCKQFLLEQRFKPELNKIDIACLVATVLSVISVSYLAFAAQNLWLSNLVSLVGLLSFSYYLVRFHNKYGLKKLVQPITYEPVKKI